MKKAIGLISGGLDSLLATRLIREQNYQVIGVHLITPFVPHFGQDTVDRLKQMSQQLNIKMNFISAGPEYLEIVKKPVFGYGQNLNPCVDCHIYMLREAKKIMALENADFVFTGEVLGQRPFSQNPSILQVIERQAGLEGLVLRPLSGLLLPLTRPEENGLVDRKRFLAIQGKQRKVQLAIAQEKNLTDFGNPGGGCLLTVPSFCQRLADLMKAAPDFSLHDCWLLQVGRHFRIGESTKVIIPREEEESARLRELRQPRDLLVSIEEYPDFTAIVQGKLTDLALELIAAYSPGQQPTVVLNTGEQKIRVSRKTKNIFAPFLIR
ncbi:MAG: tRNA 4-thiouridine(8) synthase ThiI [Candidatus Omnitrophica bacterium]|nr:tRNA 4-thiouridine(8) synthase ThiI [Candidatus Omnitrophota bacterium]